MIKESKPIIGILPTFNLTNEENDPYLDTARFVTMYSERITEAGGIPIGILNENVEEYFSICDGYLWCGGEKINSSFNTCILDALKNGKPFLGICMGAQALSTYLTMLEEQEKENTKTLEEIYQENKKEKPYIKALEKGNIHNHYVTKEKESIEKAMHKVFLKENSLIASIYGKSEISVVSLHKMAIARTSSAVFVSGISEDSVVEAIEYTKNHAALLGIMWHPEVIGDTKPFLWLVSLCKK